MPRKPKALPREPKVENKYNLTVPKIRKLKVGSRTLASCPLFWRNDVIAAWCINATFGGATAIAAGAESSYWIGIYDEDAKAYAGKVRCHFSSYGGMCSYEFRDFFKPKDIDNLQDLELQESFLEKINELIDLGILIIPEEEEAK